MAVKESRDFLIQVRRTSDVSAVAGEWRTRIDGESIQIAFDSGESHLIVGPDRITIPVYEPPLSAIKALIVDFRGANPKAQELVIKTDDVTRQYDREMSFDFSENGKWLASGDPFSLWKLDREKPENVLSSGDGYPVFSPDSRWLAATDHNGIQLFKLDSSGVDARGLVGSYGSVYFSRDGTTLMTLENGEIRRHSLSVQDLKKKAAVYLGRNLTSEDWRNEFPSEAYH